MIKILHFIPSAFEYFEDIRKEAFALIDALNELGFENFAFTLQYEAVNKRVKKEVSGKTRGRMNFEKIYNEKELEAKLDEADIIHLHAPFLGMGKKLVLYKQKYPRKKFVITLYRDLPYVDLFTIIIWLYNGWYLRKLMGVADFVCAKDESIFKKAGGFSMLKDDKKFMSITDLVNFINNNNPALAEEYSGLDIKGPQLHNALAYGELYRILHGE